jgi:predicted site-specific integrase-resolvase
MKRKNALQNPIVAASLAVLYARVSSKEQQKDGYSIPAQIKLLRSYAQAERIKIVAEYSRRRDSQDERTH